MKTVIAFLALAAAAFGQLQFAENASAPKMNNRFYPAESTCSGPAANSVSLSGANSISGTIFQGVDFTAAAWIYIPSTATQNPYIFGVNPGGSGYAVGYNNSASQNKFMFEIKNTGAFVTWATSPTLSASVGSWHLVIGEQIAASTKIFISVDGQAFNAGVSWGTGTATAANSLVQIGGTTSTQGVCKAGIWSRAFSNADAAALYNSGQGYLYRQLPASLLTNLVTYFDFSQGRWEQGGGTLPITTDTGGMYEETNLSSTGAWFLSGAATTPTYGGPGFGQPQPQYSYNFVFEGDSQTDPNGHGTSWAQFLMMMLGARARNFAYHNDAASGTTMSQINSRWATVSAWYNADYSQNVLFIYTGTNDSGSVGAQTLLQSYITTAHAQGWKVITWTATKTASASFWGGSPWTSETTWNAFLCGSGWTGYTGTPITCSGGTSGADLVIDVGNNAGLQNPSDAVNFFADTLHLEPIGKLKVATQILPVIQAFLGF